MTTLEDANALLQTTDNPAIIGLTDPDTKTFLCRNYTIRDSGWVTVIGFDNPTVTYPSHAVEYIEIVETYTDTSGARRIEDDYLDNLTEQPVAVV